METIKKIKKLHAKGKRLMIRIGIATDFGWFELKLKLIAALKAVGYELTDIGDYELVAGENYPDFIVPLVKADSENSETLNKDNHKNGVEACESVNKIPGVCAALITDSNMTGQNEKDDDYVKCLGGQIKGYALSNKKVMTFINADGYTSIPTNQRLAKLRGLGRDRKMADRKSHFA
jgi:ribose 5-phosphate isomerase B